MQEVRQSIKFGVFKYTPQLLTTTYMELDSLLGLLKEGYELDGESDLADKTAQWQNRVQTCVGQLSSLNLIEIAAKHMLREHFPDMPGLDDLQVGEELWEEVKAASDESEAQILSLYSRA